MIDFIVVQRLTLVATKTIFLILQKLQLLYVKQMGNGILLSHIVSKVRFLLVVKCLVVIKLESCTNFLPFLNIKTLDSMIASNYKYLLIIMLLFISLFKAHANFSSATSSYVLLNTKKNVYLPFFI